MVVGWRCAVCGTLVDIDTPLVFSCPNRTADDPYHVLHLVTAGREPAPTEGQNPFDRYLDRLSVTAFAAHVGVDVGRLGELIEPVVDDFVVTPFARSDRLSDEVGAHVWVKDETGQVAGSHKARHLVSTLAHLLVAEHVGLLPARPPLAIASCGNAALAAATLARRVEWPIDVYVPTWMGDVFGGELDDLGARVHRSERRAADPPGDPAIHRFREAVADGAIPFTVQGPENAWCLDSGRTIGWEIADAARTAGVDLDRMVVQVGGGAFAACVAAGLGSHTRLDTVQAEGCAPLAAAWHRLTPDDDPAVVWSRAMRTWDRPASLADGILDDETYDWVAVARAMRASGGRPIVAAERDIVAAHELAAAAGFDASPTGTAGLAGLLAVRDELDPHQDVAVVMSGVAR